MYILFSPSEGKKFDGQESFLSKDKLLFPELYNKRVPLLQKYNELISNSSIEDLQKLTGIKKETEIQKYKNDLFKSNCIEAIKRYDGVAYDYLDIDTLDTYSEEFLFLHVVIFSNLFGPILAGDKIPTYKFKQGSTLDGVNTEKIYKQEFSRSLDNLFKDELILDLRAGFYEKFYTLNQPFVTMKFLKGGKSVSHWAKAYRGKVLRTISKIQPKTQEELENINFDGLKLIETTKYKKFGKMLVYEVIDNS